MVRSGPDGLPASPWEAMAPPRGHVLLAWMGAWVRMVAWTVLLVLGLVLLRFPDTLGWARDPVGSWMAVELETVTDRLDREAQRDQASGTRARLSKLPRRGEELRRVEAWRTRWRRLEPWLERLGAVVVAWGLGGVVALRLASAEGIVLLSIARAGGLLAVAWLLLQAGWDQDASWRPVLWVLPAFLAVGRAMTWLLLTNRWPWPFWSPAPASRYWCPTPPTEPDAPDPSPKDAGHAPLRRESGQSLASHAATLRELARRRAGRGRQLSSGPTGLARRWRQACQRGTTLQRVDLVREALRMRPAWLGLMAHDDPEALRLALLEEGGAGWRIARPFWRLPFLGRT